MPDADAATKKGHWTDALKVENAALKAEVAALKAAASDRTFGADGSLPPAIAESVAPSIPFMPEEQFIDKMLAEMEIELGGGSTTGLVKKFYNMLDAKVKLRRIVIDVVRQVGIGNDWPQWSALGRDEGTGARKPEPVARPAPTHMAVVPSVSEGGMPMESRPGRADIMRSLGVDPAAGIREDMQRRAAVTA